MSAVGSTSTPAATGADGGARWRIAGAATRPGAITAAGEALAELEPDAVRSPARTRVGREHALPAEDMEMMRNGVIDQRPSRRRPMSAFSPEEIDYLRGQRLGRLATVGRNGQPHVVPVGFRYNPEQDAIEIGGHGLTASKKYRDVLRHPRVAFVVDDVVSVQPWRVRGVEIRGEAEALPVGGKSVAPALDDELLRIRPQRVRSWGLHDGGRGSSGARAGG